MQLASLGFRTDVALRAAEGSEVTDRGGYLVIRSPGNPGFWWGNFLLLRSWPRGSEGWLDRFAAEFPQAEHVAIGVDATEADGQVPAEFASLEPETSTVLTCAGIRAPGHVNTEAEIRPLESDRDWRQSVELNLRCYGEPTPGDFQQLRSTTRRRLTQAGRAAWFGAFDGGRLVAQLGICDAGGGLARYQDVETDPAARRRGLAGTLVWHAGRFALAAFGASTLVIVADPDEGAIRIYRACGFADAQTQFSFARPAGG
ncbi:MAG TPA: GNAT family N-acetyltransferase [Streptosporangiaceae bacterium]|nr:GNAT family N-acetyltransferase [Streptosporangiaceae bacterium]